MTPSQAELFLHLAENRHDAGTELINEMRRMGSAHGHALLEEEQMLIKALEINRQDQERFANYLPQRPQTLHQALQHGPRAAITGGRDEAKESQRQEGQRPQATGHSPGQRS